VCYPEPELRHSFYAAARADPLLLPKAKRFHGAMLREQTTATIHRREMLSDREWYHGFIYNQWVLPNGLDPIMRSMSRLPHVGGSDSFTVFRERTGRGFTERERQLLDLLNYELAMRVGAPLAMDWHRSRQGLTPRQTQVLNRLLEGESEKEAAQVLGLSQHRVHDCVKAIYDHFQVRSRGELLAYFIRRCPESIDPE
jgi:DNA-binding CsgD family transcriptional regulator